MDRRRAETVCVAGIAVTGLYALVLLPIAPSLVGTHPILLETLRGSTISMVTGGAFARVGEASLLLAFLAPFATLMVADPFFWWAGRLWGRDAAARLMGQRSGRWTERGLRWADRYGAWLIVFNYFQPVPSVLIYAGAGWTGMSLRRFLVLDLVGTALWVTVNVGLGYALGHPAVSVAKAFGHYSLYLTIVLVVALIVMGARRSRQTAGSQ